MIRLPLVLSSTCFGFTTLVMLLVQLTLKTTPTSSSSTITSEATSPRPYPVTFSIEFVTNITSADGGEKNGLESHAYNDIAVRGKLWYDWTKRAQRIDHGPGSYECVHFYNTSGQCSLIFLADGMYRLVPIPSDNLDNNDTDLDDRFDCCLDLPGIGPPPPDWASSSSTATWRGAVWDDYSQIISTEWWYDRNLHYGDQTLEESHAIDDQESNKHKETSISSVPQTSVRDFHTMRQVGIIPIQQQHSNEMNRDDNKDYKKYAGRPLLFTFPGKANGRQDMYFDYRSMCIGPLLSTFSSWSSSFSSSLFDLPDGCRQKKCTQPSTASSRVDKRSVFVDSSRAAS